MTPTEIPQSIKDQIEAEAKAKFPDSVYIPDQEFVDGWRKDYCDAVYHGYRLALDQAPYIFGPERTKRNQG